MATVVDGVIFVKGGAADGFEDGMLPNICKHLLDLLVSAHLRSVR